MLQSLHAQTWLQPAWLAYSEVVRALAALCVVEGGFPVSCMLWGPLCATIQQLPQLATSWQPLWCVPGLHGQLGLDVAGQPPLWPAGLPSHFLLDQSEIWSI